MSSKTEWMTELDKMVEIKGVEAATALAYEWADNARRAKCPRSLWNAWMVRYEAAVTWLAGPTRY